MDAKVQRLHDFWFGPLDDAGFCAPAQHDLWFKKSDVTDATCRREFGDWVEQALAGELDHWADSDPGLVALVILLDQFTRNIYRDSPKAFAGDPKALALVQACIAAGHHQRLPAIHQVFLFMPLEHSEDLDVQEECVALFEELAAITGSELMRNFTGYAVAHREVIARFGRFPHRNRILGRQSSAEEEAYLARNGGF